MQGQERDPKEHFVEPKEVPLVTFNGLPQVIGLPMKPRPPRAQTILGKASEVLGIRLRRDKPL